MKTACNKHRVLFIFLFFFGTSSLSLSQPAELYINEFQASSDSLVKNPYSGAYGDWIEIYNAGSTDVDISGYFLTDNPLLPNKWQISFDIVLHAGEYTLFWADDLNEFNHTNFKLGRAGEFIGFYDELGNAIDSLSYGYQEDELSYGRRIDNLQEWVFYEDGTPGYANSSTYISGRSEKPSVSIPGGFYSGSQSISITALDPGTQIHYTLDGTVPGISDPVYVQPIIIDTTTALRIRTYSDGKLPGNIITQTYFIDEEINLPFISLVTEPDNLFDDEIGIYVIGTNGKPGYCTDTPMNVNMDWERPINIELYDVNGTRELNQRAGVKIFGGCSRTRYPQKSLALHARSVYGKGSFDVQLFKDKPIYEFESFILRSSADDCRYTMFKDAMGQAILEDMDIDQQAYRPAVVFINGQYWGIHNIREKINEHYAAGNYNLDSDEINLLKRNPEQPWNIMHGSADHYNTMINYVSRQDMTMDRDYDYVDSKMNLTNYIDYQIAEIYLSANDWPGNNIKFWRADSGPYDKWRWIIYDLDNCFFYTDRNTLELATDPNCDCGWPNPPWSTQLFRRLLINERFKDEFIQRYAWHMNTTFSASRVHHYIDSMKANIEAEIPRHITRWGGQTVPNPEHWIGPTFNSMEEWEYQIDRMKGFVSERRPYAREHVINKFWLDGMVRMTIVNNQMEAGRIKVVGQNMTEEYHIGEYFQGVPIEVKAISSIGYSFSHWEYVIDGEEAKILNDQVVNISPEKNFSLIAYFNDPTEPDPGIVINEINYHSGEEENPGDWIELYNRKDEIIDLSGWTIRDDNDEHIFNFPAGYEISPNGYLVICEDIVAFESVHKDSIKLIGNLGFGLSNGGETIRLYSPNLYLIDEVPYDDEAPWPIEPDGMGPTLELIDPALYNELAENWKASFSLGTPGRQNFSNTIENHSLSQNYPNPSLSVTQISFSMQEPGYLSIQLYDIYGRQISNLINGFKEKSAYHFYYDTSLLPTGIYFYSMIVDNQLIDTKKMVVIQ